MKTSYENAAQNPIFQKAKGYYKEKDFTKAIDQCERLLLQSRGMSNDLRTLIFGLRGNALYEQENYGAAIIDYEKAIEKEHPKVRKLYPRLVQAYYNTKRYDEAIVTCNVALGQGINNAAIRQGLKESLWAKRDYLEIEHYEASEHGVKTDIIRSKRIHTLLAKQNYAEVERYCLQIIDNEPDYSPAYNDLGLAYDGMEKYEEATKSFRLAEAKCKVPQDKAVIIHNRTVTAIKQGKYAEAHQGLEEAVALNPTNRRIQQALEIYQQHYPQQPGSQITQSSLQQQQKESPYRQGNAEQDAQERQWGKGLGDKRRSLSFDTFASSSSSNSSKSPGRRVSFL